MLLFALFLLCTLVPRVLQLRFNNSVENNIIVQQPQDDNGPAFFSGMFAQRNFRQLTRTKSQILNPKPQTQTPNPKPQTPNPPAPTPNPLHTNP